MNMDYQVVVAGGGPVGLMLACELRLAGVTVAVLERREDIDPTIRAGSVNLPTAEALYRRGLLPRLAALQQANIDKFLAFVKKRQETGSHVVKPPPKFAGHFAGMMLSADLLDAEDPAFDGHGPASDLGLVMQQDLESVLGEWAADLGVVFRRGVTVTGFSDTGSGVDVECGTETIRAHWLVGCDGGRSTVRRLAGFDFPGTEPTITCYQAIADMSGADDLRMGWNETDQGIYTNGPIPNRILVVDPDGAPTDRDAPVTVDELQARIRKVTGVDVTVNSIETATRFTDNARQAAEYRKGRVLLAGDAAHVHSPFGGQGLNLGIGDAVNLGWKLASVVHGTASEQLLDTYTAERHPIGAWVLEWTRAQVALMRLDARSRAMREVTRDLMGTVQGTTYFVKKISGVWQHYDLPGGHDWIGRTAPDLEFADGTRLADHLHHGRPVLFNLSDQDNWVAGYAGRVDRVTLKPVDDPPVSAFLVRPDGIVAWVDGAETTLPEVLATWCGTPDPA